MSLLGLVKGKGASGFGYSSTAEQVTEGISLKGKTILVTGAASGLGTETVRVLAARGARVLATGRTTESVERACRAFGEQVVAHECELSKPASIRACVERVRAAEQPLAAIVCNAGIMALPKLERACGYELQFFTNHIGHFILVTGLLDRLADDGRVVVVSSEAHRQAPKGGIEFDNLSGEKRYGAWTAYGQSKLSNILFAKELAKRLRGSRKTANALHPGVIVTALKRSMPTVGQWALQAASPLLLKSIPEGASTQCFVATHPSVAGTSGEYFSNCNVAQPMALAGDAELATRLWAESERIAASV